MSLIDRVFDIIEQNRGKQFNCIPFNDVLPRFSDFIPGIKKSTYYAVTGAPGSAKTQITDYLFLYHPYEYAMNRKLEVEIVYFSFEISKELKILSGISRKLFQDYGIRLSPTMLQSIGKVTLSDDVLEKVKLTYDYFKNLEKYVTFYDTSLSPSQMFKIMEERILSSGTCHYKLVTKDGKTTKEFDRYEPSNPDKYLIFITDHISLITPDAGQTLHQALTAFSSNNVFLRNRYGATIVNVHQQSSEGSVRQFTNKGESVASKVEPQLALLGDNKTLGRDYDIVFGMFSPFKHDMNFYRGYKEVKRFEDKCRFLSIVKNRVGSQDYHIGLYFDGAVGYFEELPKAIEFEVVKNGVKSLNEALFQKYIQGEVGLLDSEKQRTFNFY